MSQAVQITEVLLYLFIKSACDYINCHLKIGPFEQSLMFLDMSVFQKELVSSSND